MGCLSQAGRKPEENDAPFQGREEDAGFNCEDRPVLAGSRPAFPGLGCGRFARGNERDRGVHFWIIGRMATREPQTSKSGSFRMDSETAVAIVSSLTLLFSGLEVSGAHAARGAPVRHSYEHT